MISIKKHIPNTITCLNLLCGSLACMAAFKGISDSGYIFFAAVLICAAAVFDFLDGFAARLLKAYSPMGKELDSLSDLVSFGLAPSIIAFCLIGESLEATGISAEYLPFLAFAIPVFSALRLAKFNIDDRQSTSFIGLPVPANALFWIGLYFICARLEIYCPIVIGVLVLLFSYLLVSNIPMFSLKFHNYTVKDNYLRYSLLLISAVFITVFGFGGFAPAILLYIFLSFIDNSMLKSK